MKLNSNHLEAFFVTAKKKHFTLAADELHITQSALSQRIAKLEQELETTLFIRDKKNLRLTDMGQKLLRYCQTSSAMEDEFLEQFLEGQNAMGGSINLGCFSSVGRSLVIPALKPLILKNPKLSLNLLTREIDDLFSLLETSEAHYILNTMESTRSDMENILLGYEINQLVKTKKKAPSHVYLDHDPSDLTTQRFFSVNKMPFAPKTRHYLDDVYGLIDGVKMGLGMAVLPRHLIVNEKNLEVVNPSKTLKIPIYLQFYKQAFYRSTHEPILNHLKDYFKKQLG